MSQLPISDEWVTPADFAALAHLRVATIHRYHHCGRIPPAEHYVGRTPLWRRAVADDWVARRQPRGNPAWRH